MIDSKKVKEKAPHVGGTTHGAARVLKLEPEHLYLNTTHIKIQQNY